MFCPECGKTVEDDVIFCSNCGVKVDENLQAVTPAIQSLKKPMVIMFMENGTKKFSLAIFGIVLVCFFLPFITVSCQGQKITTLTGIQLVTGTTIEQPSMFGKKQVQKVSGEPLAALVFLCAAFGLGSSFIKGKKSAIAPAAAGGIGLISLLMLKLKLDNEILREGKGMLELEYGVGFWVVLILFLIAIVLNVYLMQGKTFSLLEGIGTKGYKFCTHCGSKNDIGNGFCSDCGTKFP